MKLKRKYKVTIEDSGRLSSVYEQEKDLWRWCLLSLMIVGIICCIAIMIAVISPARRLLPGYLGQSERTDATRALLKVDSIAIAYKDTRDYLDNLLSVLYPETIKNETESPSAQTHTTDTIISASQRERKFIEMVQKRDKYNISVLSPLAAEGMIFVGVSQGAALSSCDDPDKVKIIIPKDEPILSVADGRVVDIYYAPAEGGYVVIIQHSKGFVSRCAGIAYPIVHKNDIVESWQAIGSGAGHNGKISIELWRDGDPLQPLDFIPLIKN